VLPQVPPFKSRHAPWSGKGPTTSWVENARVLSSDLASPAPREASPGRSPPPPRHRSISRNFASASRGRMPACARKRRLLPCANTAAAPTARERVTPLRASLFISAKGRSRPPLSSPSPHRGLQPSSAYVRGGPLPFKCRPAKAGFTTGQAVRHRRGNWRAGSPKFSREQRRVGFRDPDRQIVGGGAAPARCLGRAHAPSWPSWSATNAPANSASTCCRVVAGRAAPCRIAS